MEVLVDRYVRITDELKEMIQEMGAQPLDLRVASVLKALPPCSSTRQRDHRRCLLLPCKHGVGSWNHRSLLG
jgi:hypothetical protein